MIVGQITGLGKCGGSGLLYIFSVVLFQSSDLGKYNDSSIFTAHFK
jgi:hypothetical protein